MLGLCPALAVSVSVQNAVGMGLAATFVLISSNTIISLFGRFFPARIRIPCYIVVIAIDKSHCPKAEYGTAGQFIKWITGAEAQQLIREFKLLGKPLFTPNARQ